MGDNNHIRVVVSTLPRFGSGISVAKGLQVGFGINEPLQVKYEEVRFTENENYLGVPGLTELRLKYKENEFVLNDCILTVTQERNILETNLQGRDGTVKQYISDGDYHISVQASIAGDGANATNQNYDTASEYPLTEMAKFVKLLTVKDALLVSSDWLDIFKIRSVVIKNYDITQETYSNRQTFTMQMLSDEPFEIKLLK